MLETGPAPPPATLFIGMPVFNGEPFVGEAVESLRRQNLAGWRLLISDNASADGTEAIGRRFAAEDGRIRYHRHDRNIGAAGNFEFLLRSADCPFFMWAAADDLWEPGFVEACLGLLRAQPEAGMAFSGIVNVDRYGEAVRAYPGFARFSRGTRLRVIGRYIFEAETMGKANLIYSVYRTEVCRRAWQASPLSGRFGSDMSLVLAALARTRLATTDAVLFKKRVVRSDDEPGRRHPIDASSAATGFRDFALYARDHLRAARRTAFFPLVAAGMSLRLLAVAARRARAAAAAGGLPRRAGAG